jgi:hypothetical protein
MPTHRPKPFALTGRASGRKSRALRDRRSSGRWRSGWRSSRSGSGIRTHTHASSPAGGAVHAGWLALSPPHRGRSSRARTPSRSVGHNRPISSVAGDDDAAAGADFRRASPGPRRVRFRHDHRLRHRGAGIGPLPNPDPPLRGGRENRETDPRRQGGRVDRETDPRPRRARAALSRIRIGGAAAEVGAAVAARARALLRARAARPARVTAPHQAEGLRSAVNTPE